MPQHLSIRRRWPVGYGIVLLAMAPLALPCWDGFLRNVVGRFLTVKATHLVEYAGLGWLTAGYALACKRPWRRLMTTAALVGGVGLLDEVLQVWLPQRVFGWSDVALNWVGGLGGLLGATLGSALSAWESRTAGRR